MIAPQMTEEQDLAMQIKVAQCTAETLELPKNDEPDMARAWGKHADGLRSRLALATGTES